MMDCNTLAKGFVAAVLLTAGAVLGNKTLNQAGKNLMTKK
jgi:hypothetical protein